MLHNPDGLTLGEGNCHCFFRYATVGGGGGRLLSSINLI